MSLQSSLFLVTSEIHDASQMLLSGTAQTQELAEAT